MPDWTLRRWALLWRQIRDFEPDCVHVQYPTQGYAGGGLACLVPLLSWMAGAKVVQTWHEPCHVRPLLEVFAKTVVPSSLVVVRPMYRERHLHPLVASALSSRAITFIPNASVVPRATLDAEQISAARVERLAGQKRLVVFFGFVMPNKGAELVFDIADPATDYVIIAGEIGDEGLRQTIQQRIETDPWKGKAVLTGFLPVEQIETLLAIADAVVLPFRGGGGEWNSSIHAATAQGTFVLTTSLAQRGYSAAENTYFSKVDDIVEMRQALAVHAGRHIMDPPAAAWPTIAKAHIGVYQSLLGTVGRVVSSGR